jgi:hypothetical protein
MIRGKPSLEKKMNCYRVKDRMVPYMKGAVEPYERKEIAEHLAGCPTCKEEYFSLLMRRDFGSTETYYHDPKTAKPKFTFLDRLFPEGRVGPRWLTLILGKRYEALLPIFLSLLRMGGILLVPEESVRSLELSDYLRQHQRATKFKAYEHYTFTELEDFSRRLPKGYGYFGREISQTDLRFLGAEILSLNGNQVAHVVSRRNDGFVSFFLTRGEPARLVRNAGFLPLGPRDTWTAESGKTRIWLRSQFKSYLLVVTELSPDSLPPFSDLIG